MLLFSGKQKLLATVFWILSQVHGAPHAPLDPKDDFVQRNFNTIQRIYNLTVYPNNMPIVQKGAGEVPKDLFADKVVGRVSPVGNFTGFADSIEYFFGLAPVPTAVPTGIAIYQAYLSHFSSECPGIASSVVQLRTGKVDPTTGQLVPSALTTTLKQVAFWKFNKNGEVMQYEAWIPNLQAWTEYANGISFSNPLIQTAVPFQLCPTIQQRCTGKNQQFSNTTTCILGLERKPFGNFDAAWGDNIACRNIHLMLTLVRPEVHCAHVGAAGGSPPDNWKCTNTNYTREYTNDQELFGNSMPFDVSNRLECNT